MTNSRAGFIARIHVCQTSKLSQGTQYLASLLSGTVVKCICRNISRALGKRIFRFAFLIGPTLHVLRSWFDFPGFVSFTEMLPVLGERRGSEEYHGQQVGPRSGVSFVYSGCLFIFSEWA